MATEDEDYGDYVTRCICGFTHDDGYMICCDQCSVWQHVECMKVNPKNLPDKYLCEECEPRPVDKKKAKIIQLKKKDDISDFDEDDSSSDRSNSMGRSTSASPHPPSIKKRKKAQRTSSGGTLRVHELKAEARRNKKEKVDKDEVKKSAKKKSKHHHHHHHHHNIPSGPPSPGSVMTGLQTLLTAASAIEEQQQKEDSERSMKPYHPTSMFNSTTSPWKDPYKIIDTNQYTDALKQQFKGQLDQLKKEAVVYTKEEYSNLGSFPLCLVRDVGVCRKGLVSEAHIPEDEMILEYKAKITTKDLLCTEPTFTTPHLWKQKPCPFVFQYDKLSGGVVCLDARVLGNTARFIRRSCSPNAELRHFFVNDDIHFGVYATHHISPEEEVSVPFDFPFEKCDYPMECACGKRNGSCHMMKQLKKRRREGHHPPPPTATPTTNNTNEGNRKSPIVTTPTSTHQQEPIEGTGGSSEQHQHQSTSTRKAVVPKAGRGGVAQSLLQPDEDSNSSWTSSGSAHRRKMRRTVSQSSNSQQPSRDPSDSESEDIENEMAKKRKSREERKTEAVWKMFEKMEARGRKKLNSSSDAGTPMEEGTSTPTGATTTILKTERRLSTNSRKVQLLPPVKHRLSSVSSSTDFMSPEHPPDAFTSPPLTPSVATPTAPPTQSLPPTTESSDPPAMPTLPSFHHLPSPFAALPKLTFEVTPYLHPKYLLADFALPRKKAILRQWEMEQRDVMVCHDNGDYGTNDWMSNGFEMACIRAMEGNKPRQRGCLKHRWIDLHNKQLQDVTVEHHQCVLPHKKRVLQRWIQATPTVSNDPAHLTEVSPTSLTPPPSSSPSPSLTSSITDTKPSSDSVPDQIPLTDMIPEPDRTPSPPPPTHSMSTDTPIAKPVTDRTDLFDDFSDDDFEEISDTNHDKGSNEVGGVNEENGRGQDNNDIDTKDNMDDNLTTNDIHVTTNTSTNEVTEQTSVLSERDDNDSNHGDTDDHAPDTTRPDLSSFESISPEPMQSSTSDNEHVTAINIEPVSDPANDGVSEGNEDNSTPLEDNPESIEMDLSSPALPAGADLPDSTPRDDDVINKSSDMYIDTGERSELLISSDPKPGSGAKKKMSLLEYRSRSRKPSEHMTSKPALDTGQLLSSVMTTPILPTSSSPLVSNTTSRSSHSFLSYSSSFLSTSSANRITKPLGDTVSSPTLSTPSSRLSSDTNPVSHQPPQFEPVSPDEDGSGTPVIDEVSSRPSSLPPPPPPPPHPTSTNVPLSSYGIPPHTPTNIPPQGVWGPQGDVTTAIDPRRVQPHPPPPPPPHGQDMYLPCPPPPPHNHQSALSPQEMIHYPPPMPLPPHSMPRPHHPYTTIMHQQIRAPPPMGGVACVPPTGAAYGQQQPHPPRMPHPTMLHQPPIRHPGNNNFYQ